MSRIFGFVTMSLIMTLLFAANGNQVAMMQSATFVCLGCAVGFGLRTYKHRKETPTT